MNCSYCGGTGKYKKPHDQKLFDELIDAEMDKGYSVNYYMAEKMAYSRVGYTFEPCPHCTKLATGDGD